MAARQLGEIAHLPAPGDNAAIAVRRMPAGTPFELDGSTGSTSHVVLEGHRFAARDISRGEQLLSWGLPFGTALRPIGAGEYLCNEGMLAAMRLRDPDLGLPDAANFEDYRDDYALDESAFVAGEPLALHAIPESFDGYARPGNRGVGTRNHVVVLGTTSLTASFCRLLAARCADEARDYEQVDGISPVTHTEGGEAAEPNNVELLLRTLAGFIVHPNVGAVLAVDYGTEAVDNTMLERFMRDNGYPIDDVPHRFFSVREDFDSSLDEAAGIVRALVPLAAATGRTPQPLGKLRIALQCGGSDAFSGVSGNPLAGRAAREVLRHGGSAALAETDELIGAESYLLANTKDLDTAKLFLQKVAAFKQWIGWHGYTAEGNTSGGNKMRGLYNNALKSIGAARKKDPDVRLDYVIDYARPMTGPGFYFMDSPGNDLESIAGQVAAGCNLIFFVTGNGSITNFPFVPTVKFMTTTSRWNLLSSDMDINAGRYQDGTSLQDLGRESFAYTVDIASGKRSVGERAGHSQVSIWRNWRQVDGSQLERLQNRPRPDGNPVEFESSVAAFSPPEMYAAPRGHAADRVGLIVPTSLCAGQIALAIAGDLSATSAACGRSVTRFVALPHTEGCGASSGDNEDLYLRTLAGHLVHPFVAEALLLEHGCEHTHNDLFRHRLAEYGVDAGRFGYASIQLDGGIHKVRQRVAGWFEERLEGHPDLSREATPPDAMSIALLASGPLPADAATGFANVAASILNGGGTVVIPDNSALLRSNEFCGALGIGTRPLPSIDYGQFVTFKGLHVMATPSTHVVETITGLGGTGVQLMMAFVQGPPLQGHPMVPLLQVSAANAAQEAFARDMDCVLAPGTELLPLVRKCAGGEYVPRRWADGNTDFQFTRGLLGVSL